ncbi:MAG: hypothetical protein ACE5EB_05570 [Thermodesulfobacteriota bacterium]
MGEVKVLKIVAAAFLAVIFLSPGVHAQRMRILDQVDIEETEVCAAVHVGFNIPMRYIKHFPYESGTELRIQLEAITISPAERDALFEREHFKPPPNDIASLTEVEYEGNIDGGPFLNLFFDRVVEFKVSQGEDYRSILIIVTWPGETDTCEYGK